MLSNTIVTGSPACPHGVTGVEASAIVTGPAGWPMGEQRFVSAKQSQRLRPDAVSTLDPQRVSAPPRRSP